MNYLTKLKIGIFVTFLTIFIFVYQISNKILDAYMQTSYVKNLELLKSNYKANINLYTTIADGFYGSLINQEELLSLLSQAKNTQDTQEKEKLRKKLFSILEPHFKYLTKKGLKSILFAFEENDVFLRVHKPDMHGDDISKSRKTIVDANKEKKVLHGFEGGKSSHAFRNTYPLFYKDEFLGAVDLSFSSDCLQKNISDIYGVYTHFLVKKSLLESNPNYLQSFEHDGYLYAKTRQNSKNERNEIYAGLVKPIQKDIQEKMDKEKSFVLWVDNEEASFILAFEPIYEYKRLQVAAYLVSYTKDNGLHLIKESHAYSLIALFTMLALLALAFLYIIKQKESLEKEVKLQTNLLEREKTTLEKALKAFDKNVIFSTTNLAGHITEASEAFCEISGYEKEELLKKAHNIVRHPDMPSEIFKEMWNSLKNEGHWIGDIKNRKKDGSFYWVHSRIECEYDENNRAIGYYAIREDISAQKEVERLKEELEEFNTKLEDEVKERTQEIVALNHEIQETQKEVVFTMGAIGESRSKETGDHVKRVAEYSKLLALYYGVDPDNAELLKQASPMHDIGKIAIPDAILNKPGPFDEEERKIMDEHAKLGFDMLKHSSRPLLKMAATVAYEHHEKWDGSGYPNKLAGEDISVYGRITAIADVFDALGSDRVYKKAWELEKILQFFKEERAKHFDPKLVDILFEHLDEFLEIRDIFKN